MGNSWTDLMLNCSDKNCLTLFKNIHCWRCATHIPSLRFLNVIVLSLFEAPKYVIKSTNFSYKRPAMWDQSCLTTTTGTVVICGLISPSWSGSKSNKFSTEVINFQPETTTAILWTMLSSPCAMIGRDAMSAGVFSVHTYCYSWHCARLLIYT